MSVKQVGAAVFFAATLGLVWTAGAQNAGKSMREHAQDRMQSDAYAGINGRPGNGPAYGSPAPDFSLMPLKFYEFGINDTDITEETAGMLYEPVRLSDFKGVKPVVLIFGSYT